MGSNKNKARKKKTIGSLRRVSHVESSGIETRRMNRRRNGEELTVEEPLRNGEGVFSSRDDDLAVPVASDSVELVRNERGKANEDEDERSALRFSSLLPPPLFSPPPLP